MPPRDVETVGNLLPPHLKQVDKYDLNYFLCSGSFGGLPWSNTLHYHTLPITESLFLRVQCMRDLFLYYTISFSMNYGIKTDRDAH
jgi:hypothetical protein